MPISASVLASVIPMISYMLIIWVMDKYDREPLLEVIKHFLWGAVGAVLLTLIFSNLLAYSISGFVTDKEALALSETVLIAPFVEELTKGLFLFITIRNRKFDNMTDGLVYGGAVGLGFGMTENFLYFISGSQNIIDWFYLVIIRSGFSAVMHCLSTATLGAFLGIAKFSHRGKYFYAISGLFTAMLIHFLWNLSVSFQSTFIFGFLFIIFTAAIFILTLNISTRNERKLILTELKDEAALRLIPADHVNLIGMTKRERLETLDSAEGKKYFRYLVKLAFRKSELKKLNQRNSEFINNEIMRLRKEINKYLNSNKQESLWA